MRRYHGGGRLAGLFSPRTVSAGSARLRCCTLWLLAALATTPSRAAPAAAPLPPPNGGLGPADPAPRVRGPLVAVVGKDDLIQFTPAQAGQPAQLKRVRHHRVALWTQALPARYLDSAALLIRNEAWFDGFTYLPYY